MNLIQLTAEQRLDARERAKQYIVKMLGEQPHPENFQNYSVSKYPAWVTRMIAVMLAITAVASALPSLFRLFTAGRDYFLQGINEPLQGAIVGVATFMLAEFLVVLSTISANVLYTGRTRWLFSIPVIMGLSMAIVGNVTVVRPHDVFSWLEALVPVFAVLFIALIGERLTLESIQNRHASTRAYESALVEWQKLMATADSHPKFAQAHAEAIRQEIIAVNSRGSGATARKEYLSSITPQEWKTIVIDELARDDWFTTEHAQQPKKVVEVPNNPFGNIAHEQGDQGYGTMTVTANGNGYANIVSQNGKM